MPLHAIIIAGGRLPKALRPLSASPVKALLTVGQATLLETSVRAVRESGMVQRIAVVGNAEVERAATKLRARDGAAGLEYVREGDGAAGLEYVREGESVIDNILYGFAALGGLDHEYLIVSPDLPFLSGDALAAFVAAARLHAALALPLVAQADFLARFPGAPNHFERLDGARVTLGSCVYCTGPMLQSNIPLGRDFYRYRKLPHRLALLLGLPIAWAFLTRRLKLAMLERRAEQLTGGAVRGVWLRDAGIAYDVDNRQNYEYALRMLGGEEQPQNSGA
jgi:2-C-methyl-D-erythritol 4-phosphate cytidylyltransferase